MKNKKEIKLTFEEKIIENLYGILIVLFWFFVAVFFMSLFQMVD